jgi:arylsulfatase A-like enzyme
MNVIFILIDALRPDHLSCYGYNRETSPNIDNLAKQGVLFENTFSSDNLTNKSTLAILSGRHLLTNKKGFTYDEKELKSFFESGGVFLQEILKKNGYKTYCLHHLYGWRKIGFDYYFKDDKKVAIIKKIPGVSKISKNLFYKFGSKKMINKIKFKRDSERMINEAIDIIKEEDNFFIKLPFNDTHMPYNYPQNFTKFHAENKSERIFDTLSIENGYNKQYVKFCKENLDENCEIEDIKAMYDNAIAYNDYLIGKIIKTLKEEGIFEKTIIVIFSDHGESLGEHKIYSDHHGLYDVSMHVPLIISGNVPKNKKIKTLTSLQDITPTVLDLVGIRYDDSLFDGKSLLPLMFDEKDKIRDLVFMEEITYYDKKAIRTEDYKYMESSSKEGAMCSRCNNYHGGIIELYDLKKDPGENINIAKSNKELLLEMKLKLDKTIRDLKTVNEKRRIKKVFAGNKNI